MRQNLSHPGKVLHIRSSPEGKIFPYGGVNELLFIADSGNNRIVILNASTNTFVDQIGSSISGFKDGSFEDA